MATRKKRAKVSRRSRLAVINPNAAGIDVGSRIHVGAVGAECDAQPVRTFGTFTEDLHALGRWFHEAGVTSVAMESTGVYWIPVFEVLEQMGFDVILVNAREAKSVPGRKSDVNDAQWIQQLHQYGLLRGSFQPPQAIAPLRAYMRHRERLLDYAAAHTQHMQKALMQMNIQLHHVVNDITGKTGMGIIHDIIAGEHDPHKLAQHRDPRCNSSVETICAALVGNYQPEHLFALTQAVELRDFYERQVKRCDEQIEASLKGLSLDADAPCEPMPPRRGKARRQANEPCFDVRAALFALLGVDLTQINGIGPSVALKLVAECGTNLSNWPSAKHFTSWLTLAPGTKISGGRVLSSRTRRSTNRAAAVLRMAAVTVGKTETALGAFYRRLSSRVGKAKAVTATARKIAVLFYNTLRYGMRYEDPGADYYEARYRQRVIKNLRRRAATLGLTVGEATVEGVP
jgi:transposase